MDAAQKRGGIVGAAEAGRSRRLRAAAMFARLYMLPVKAQRTAAAGAACSRPGRRDTAMAEHRLPRALRAASSGGFAPGDHLYVDGLPQRTFRMEPWRARPSCSRRRRRAAGRAQATSARRRLPRLHLRRSSSGAWSRLSFPHRLRHRAAAREPASRAPRLGARFGHALRRSSITNWRSCGRRRDRLAVAWRRAESGRLSGPSLILWLMRLSAKLNLFLGVRNLNDEFLPPHLSPPARAIFRRRPMNLALPASRSRSRPCSAAVYLVVAAPDAARLRSTTAGHDLLATLLALAVLEHWSSC